MADDDDDAVGDPCGELARTCAALRVEMLRILREGFGYEQLSPAEQQTRLDDLESEIMEVWHLFARAAAARALGVFPLFAATLGSSTDDE